jgi:tetratricopeptide (TPR) repeat protein
VAEPPIFAWSIGEEIASAWRRTADALGTPSPLTARVSILDDLKTVWESPVKSLEMSRAVDVSVEADRVHDLACPPEVDRRLNAGRKYHWRLILTIGVSGRRGHLERRVVVQQAAFRILSAQERQSLSRMLSSLPHKSTEDAESALLRGAIYESLGVYDKAIQAYEKALLDKHWQDHVYPRLADLYSKRAYELLGLSGEKPSSVPFTFLAQKANHYRSSAVLHSAV